MRRPLRATRKERTVAPNELVSVVDDDESIRDSLPDLLRSFGFDACSFSSAEEFLHSDSLERTDCLILDVAMPGVSGPELHRELIRRNMHIPTIFITAHSRRTLEREVLGRGAVACLPKPFSEVAIIDAVRTALAANENN